MIELWQASTDRNRLLAAMNSEDIYRNFDLLPDILGYVSTAATQDRTYWAKTVIAQFLANHLSLPDTDIDRQSVISKLISYYFAQEGVFAGLNPEIVAGLQAAIIGILGDQFFLHDKEGLRDFGVGVIRYTAEQIAGIEANVAAVKAQIEAMPDPINIGLLSGVLGVMRKLGIDDFMAFKINATSGTTTTLDYSVDETALADIASRISANPDSLINVFDDVTDTGITLIVALANILRQKITFAQRQDKGTLGLMRGSLLNHLSDMAEFEGKVKTPRFNLVHANFMHEIYRKLKLPPFNINIFVSTDKLFGQSMFNGSGQKAAVGILYPDLVDGQNGERIDPESRLWIMGFDGALDTGVTIYILNPITKIWEQRNISVGRSSQLPLYLDLGKPIPGKYTDLAPYNRMRLLVAYTCMKMGISREKIRFHDRVDGKEVELKSGYFPEEELLKEA